MMITPNALCSHDAICEIFGNKISKRTGIHYITGDIARFGADYARLAVWDGWHIVEVIGFPQKQANRDPGLDKIQTKEIPYS